jgi:hypothetical protein
MRLPRSGYVDGMATEVDLLEGEGDRNLERNRSPGASALTVTAGQRVDRHQRSS